MGVKFKKWLIYVIGTFAAALLIPGITISEYLFPILALGISAYVIVKITPNIFEHEGRFLSPSFFFLSLVMHLALFLAVFGITPGIIANNFLAIALLAMVTAALSTYANLKLYKNPETQHQGLELNNINDEYNYSDDTPDF